MTSKSEGECPRCPGKASTTSHTCPYQRDVNDDDNYQCDCCEECTHECAMEV